MSSLEAVYISINDSPERVEPLLHPLFLRTPDDLIKKIFCFSRNPGLLNRKFLQKWNHREKIVTLDYLNTSHVFHVLFPNTRVDQENFTEICQKIYRLYIELVRNQNGNVKPLFAKCIIFSDKCEKIIVSLAKMILDHQRITLDGHIPQSLLNILHSGCLVHEF